MCGINGVYSYGCEDISNAHFDYAVDSLRHRGPDGRGTYQDKGARLRLGHRRLAILDASERGDQPMSYLNRYWIAFNGEIYNFLELREELQQLGCSFHTDTDTEVILAAYATWGEECQHRFNGMWAFAIWDSFQKTLFLSRDRFGVKPLYIADNGKRLIFGSELKAFISFNFEFDLQAVSNALSDGGYTASSPYSLLKGVNQLQAGHSALFKRTLQIKEWWNTLDHLHDVPPSFDEQVEQYRELFFDACHLRLRSDVPLGTTLSGGLDSSSVLAAVSHLAKGHEGYRERIPYDWQKVFTMGYPGTLQDEVSYAKSMVNSLGMKGDVFEVAVPEIIKFYDQAVFQFEDVTDLPIGPWMIYREFRKQGVVISMDGQGPDEALGGYHEQVMSAMVQSLFSPRKFYEYEKILKGLYVSPSQYPGGTYFQLLKSALRENLPAPLRALIKNTYRFLKDPSRISQFFKRPLHAIEAGSGWIREKASFQDPNLSFLSDSRYKKLSPYNRVLFDYFHRRSLPTILRNIDRCSMAHGVEVRSPFMDWRVVCFGLSLPTPSKLGGGFTKRILREAMKDYLPEEIQTRQSKIGFANPTSEWFKTGLKPFILDHLNSQSFLSSPVWNGPVIRECTEKAFAQNQYIEARRSWEYIQTNKLMDLFKNEFQNFTCKFDNSLQ